MIFFSIDELNSSFIYWLTDTYYYIFQFTSQLDNCVIAELAVHGALQRLIPSKMMVT